MGIALYKNNAAGSLAIALAPSGVSMTLGAGQGASFPTIVAGSGDYFYLTITSVATPTNFEIIKVTATTTDVLTISRAQDGTVAGGVGGITFAISDTVELRIVNAGLFSLLPHGKRLFTSSGTWLCPTNITTVYLSGATGGGGGGGGGGYGGGSGGGTGGFIYGTSPLTVVPGTSYTITFTVGTGGAGGVSGNSNGVAGTSASLSFGNLYTLAGGPGGAGGVLGGGPDGLAGTSGYGIGTAGTIGSAGAGGAGGVNQTAVYLGGSGGGGGGGGNGGGGGGGNGGAGAPGFLIVEW
jgi:hypothetical protein